jgi:hypothetical protein
MWGAKPRLVCSVTIDRPTLFFLHLDPEAHGNSCLCTPLNKQATYLFPLISMSTIQNVIPEPIGSERGLFQCTTCSQTYSRVDHLARHVRTRMPAAIPSHFMVALCNFSGRYAGEALSVRDLWQKVQQNVSRDTPMCSYLQSTQRLTSTAYLYSQCYS